VPDVNWEDVGSLRNICEELQMSILAPVRYPEQFAELEISAPSGVLLCGPPGCGKTLLAKAVANEAGINFISVKGPELLNMYVGESEKAVRQCFQRARNSAPCVIFFDELDALCPKRSDSGEGGASMRVVNQMLTEMDGIESRKGVFLMAASNRPEIVDPAVLRPGRLDKILYVGIPSASDRVDILNALTKVLLKM
jgi:ribosome biogenesis ATPase